MGGHSFFGVFAYFLYLCGMIKKYKNNQEKLDAMRQAVALRQKWLQAIRKGATKEEMEKMGLKTPIVIA